MLPGTTIKPYYDRTDLLHITTETVTENLCLGVALVITILFMFVNNIRTAIIVAINIPLALLRLHNAVLSRQVGKPVVDRCRRFRHHRRFFGRRPREHLSQSGLGNHPELPIKERILLFVKEIDHAPCIPR